MKRRNFFSKISKGLLGIGIVTALPTPEVETVSEITPDTSLDLSSSSNWKGISHFDDHIYFVESKQPENEIWAYKGIDINTGKEVHASRFDDDDVKVVRDPESDVIIPTEKD